MRWVHQRQFEQRTVLHFVYDDHRVLLEVVERAGSQFVDRFADEIVEIIDATLFQPRLIPAGGRSKDSTTLLR
ncbi:hypothetical protein [Nocardia sp. NPDC056000]|uniref:hypothetical protein n=1 Tax=Nocardia sp. NPDC056000 TaxID=3345674 RepID=UPI0035DD0B35